MNLQNWESKQSAHNQNLLSLGFVAKQFFFTNTSPAKPSILHSKRRAHFSASRSPSLVILAWGNRVLRSTPQRKQCFCLVSKITDCILLLCCQPFSHPAIFTSSFSALLFRTMSRSFSEECSYLEAASSCSIRIKKGFVPNMNVSFLAGIGKVWYNLLFCFFHLCFLCLCI